jgi:hypothetical protein
MATREPTGSWVSALGFCAMTFPRRERDACFVVTFPSLQCAATRSAFADFSV